MNDMEVLKRSYIELADIIDTTNLTMLEVADKYLEELDKFNKEIYTAKLIVYCWPALEKLYYGQNVRIMSLNDCYDIFLDSFFYVMDKCVWKDESNKLYNDEDAILKAMYVLVESRRKNYFIAQNRQKRVANQYPVSLDNLSDEFQEGYFSYISEHYNFNRGWEMSFMKYLWDNKRYVGCLIFDLILHADVIRNDGLDIKKIKKYIKNINKEKYLNFLDMYDIIDNNLEIYHKYIENLSDNMIYSYIDNTLVFFKTNIKLKKAVYNNVD